MSRPRRKRAAPSPITGSRESGILLHPTSLPGRGIGTLGAEARRFVDWLASAGQGWWQVLPLVPTDPDGSPYNGLSALAGSALLIDPALLVADGLLRETDVDGPDLPADRVDFLAVTRWKHELLRRAFASFRRESTPELRTAFAKFREKNATWLGDYTLFRALRDSFGGISWAQWPAPVRSREQGALSRAREELREDVERHAFVQFLFDRQWRALRDYANAAGVRIIGDVPIFVAHDSADVWAHPDLFELKPDGTPTVVSGVPPDYFSETGQRWGNPLYRWEAMEAEGYAWWIQRFRRTLELVDVARVDHFRGFEAYWEIPAAEETALNGEWRPGPGTALFDALREALGGLPLIAEDLGLITDDVEALRDTLGLPGMRVLQFAFGDDEANPHLPANHPENSVAYTGTHDNDTSRGWYDEGAGEAERKALRRLTDAADGEIEWGMIEVVLRSDAALAIIPLQDVLGLGSDSRMNTPGTGEGNWTWRFAAGELTHSLADRLRALTRQSGRGMPRLT